MPVPDKVGVAHLDEHYRWKVFALLPRPGDANPAPPGLIVERVKVAVKVATATLTATDLVDRY